MILISVDLIYGAVREAEQHYRILPLLENGHMIRLMESPEIKYMELAVMRNGYYF